MNTKLLGVMGVLLLVVGIWSVTSMHSAEAKGMPKHDQKTQTENKVDKKTQHLNDIRDKMTKAKFKPNPLAKR